MKKNNKLVLVLLIVLNIFFLNMDLTFAVTGDSGSSTNVKIFNSGKTSTTDLSYCIDWTSKKDGKAIPVTIRRSGTKRPELMKEVNKQLDLRVAQAKKNGYTVTNVQQATCLRSGTQYQISDSKNNMPTLMSAGVDDDYTVQKLRLGDAPVSFTCTATFSYYKTSVEKHTSVRPMPAVEYNSSNPDFANISERVYCLQQGRNGPSNSAMNYKALENFDLSNCTGDSSYSYQCGLASVLLNSANVSFDANGNISKSDAGYSYAAVSSALRAYVAYYHKYIDGQGGIKDSDGSVSSGASSAEASAFDYYSATDVYDKSMEYYLKGGTPISCNDACKNKGVFCYSNDTQKKNIEDFASLLQSAVDFAKNPQNSKLADFINQVQSNTESSGDVSIGTSKDIDANFEFDKKNKNVQIELEFKKMFIGSTIVTKDTPIEVPVKYCNELDDGCNVVITVTDKYGRVIPTENLPGGCDKNYCKFTAKYSQMCTQTETTQTDNYLVVHIYGVPGGKSGSGPNAFIKNYVTASGEIAQQFVGFDINGWQTNGKTPGDEDVTPGSTVKKEDLEQIATKTTTVVCPCESNGPIKRCDNFEVQNSLSGYCSNYGEFNQGIYDTYDQGTVEEPYMNCIMNACNVSERNQYDFSDKYGVDVGICRIFCREEIEFYMANKTRVYAGMQFKYQIENVLGDKRKLTNGHSLTAMVLQKRQCASEIYYDHRNPRYNYSTTTSKYDSYIKQGYNTWQKMYGKAVKDMVDAWSSWKAYETLHKNEGWGSCNPKLNHAPEGVCKSSASSCGGSCSTGTIYPAFDYVYTWPYSGSPRYTKSTTGNPGFSYNSESKKTSNKVTFSLSGSPVPPGDQDGKYNKSSGTSSQECGPSYACPTETNKNRKCRDSKCIVTSSCEKGERGKDKCKVKSQEAALWGAFKSAVNNVTQLIYELENCNLYRSSDLNLYYNSASYVDFSGYTPHRPKYQGTFTHAIDGGTTKDYILKLANCENEEECIGLDITYDDHNYGATTTFGKEVEILTQIEDIKEQEQQTKYCVNDENEKKGGNSYYASCYNGDFNSEVDLSASNLLGKHDLVSCKGYDTNAKCEKNAVSGKQIELPINDFAIFTVVSEADFWQPKEYSTEAYTGIVREGTGSGNSLSLDKYVFPVSMDTESGSTKAYDIKHRYTKIGSKLSKSGILNHDYYEFTCQYEVYNITNLYDCELQVDDAGNVDLSDACNNLCYEIKNGVPIIREEGACAHWSDKNTNSKGYGFIYRNVELGNLFPAERPIGNNWLENSDIKDAIEATASDMYSNGNKYLQYSFILNSDAIKKIKEYNKNKNVRGGYIDNSYDQCYAAPISGSTGGFYECTTSFMNEIRTNSNNFGIQVIKSDGVKGDGY